MHSILITLDFFTVLQLSFQWPTVYFAEHIEYTWVCLHVSVASEKCVRYTSLYFRQTCLPEFLQMHAHNEYLKDVFYKDGKVLVVLLGPWLAFGSPRSIISRSSWDWGITNRPKWTECLIRWKWRINPRCSNSQPYRSTSRHNCLHWVVCPNIAIIMTFDLTWQFVQCVKLRCHDTHLSRKKSKLTAIRNGRKGPPYV